MRQIGFVGLGTMGAPMCRRLAERGWRVTVYDADSAALALAGRQPGVAVADAMTSFSGLDCVVTMLPDGDVVRSVLCGDRMARTGLADQLEPGAIVVDTSSSAPSGTVELGLELRRRGIGLVDAPVSGNPASAGAGELILMVAGASDDIDRVAGVLADLGEMIRVGPPGSGHALKALNNLLSAANFAAAIEVLTAARAYGVDPEIALGVLNRSTGRNHATETKVAQHVLSGGYDSGFRISLMAKDIRIAMNVIDRCGVAAPLAQACDELWQDALGQLPSAADNVEVAKVIMRRAGLTT